MLRSLHEAGDDHGAAYPVADDSGGRLSHQLRHGILSGGLLYPDVQCVRPGVPDPGSDHGHPGEEDGAQAILDILETYSGELGLNGYSRTLFILDGETGEYLAGNNDDAGKNLSYDSANLTHALATGEDSSSPNMAADYMDVAITLTGAAPPM